MNIFLRYQFCMKNMFFRGKFCWCNSKIKRGAGGVFSKFAIIIPLPFSYFLSQINIMYLKRTDFWCEIDNWKKYTWSFNENFEKKLIFLLALFHIGALCCKTLDGLGRLKKWTKKFNFQFFVLLLTQRMRKSCTQSEIFDLRGKFIFGTVSCALAGIWNI